MSDSRQVNGPKSIAMRPWTIAIFARAANILSVTRLVLAGAWLLAFASGHRMGAVPGSLAIAAAASDFLDGRVARRLGVASGSGRWLDSIADAVFVLCSLGCESWMGALPLYVPVLIAISFAQYAIDSIVVGGTDAAPIKSRLGHLGGIINYAIAIALGFAPPPSPPGRWINAAAPALAVFYALAIGERALNYRTRIRGRKGNPAR